MLKSSQYWSADRMRRSQQCSRTSWKFLWLCEHEGRTELPLWCNVCV